MGELLDAGVLVMCLIRMNIVVGVIMEIHQLVNLHFIQRNSKKIVQLLIVMPMTIQLAFLHAQGLIMLLLFAAQGRNQYVHTMITGSFAVDQTV